MKKRFMAIMLIIAISMASATPAFALDETVEMQETEESGVETESVENNDEMQSETSPDVLESEMETENESALESEVESEPSGETVDVQETKTEAEESEPEIYHEVVVDANPIYGDVISEEEFRKLTSGSPVMLLGEPEYAASESTFISQLRSAMEARATSFTLYYATTQPWQDGMLKNWIDKAIAETGVPTQGDYIRYHYSRSGLAVSYYNKSGTYYYTLKFNFEYHSSAAQEEEVTQALSDLLSSFNFGPGTSEYEKVKTIYDWMCSNISYDYANLNDDTYTLKYSAYAALINKTSVCQGYASLFYRLCREVGIDARVINGTGNGGAHAWNIVRIGDLWYDLDTTWDAGSGVYQFFLKCENNFGDHSRSPEFLTEEFNQQYPMAAGDYNVSSGKTWQVNYDANGGKDAPSAQTKRQGITLILSNVQPVKTYVLTYNTNGGNVSPQKKELAAVFNGWNTKKDGTGLSYGVGESYETDEGVILYAQWKNPTAGALATPTRTGYTFAGWYTAASGGTQITSSSTVKGNQTIYARWTPNTYKISYDLNGGTGKMESQTKTHAQSLTLSSAKPTKSYTITYDANGGSISSTSKKVSAVFNGWNTKKDGTGISYSAGGNYTANAAATLYAQWSNPTAGTLATPTRSGYIFDGWYTAKTGGTKVTSAGKISKDQTIYAHWAVAKPVYSDDVEAFVAQLYNVCLDREPDKSGLNLWTSRLKAKEESGVSAAYGFIFSNEFKNKNLCNEDYIEQLYKAFMGRSSDAEGKKLWLKELSSGKTREEVFNGFALSNEFANLCKKYGINQGTAIEIPKYGTVPTGSCSVCGKEDGVTGFVKRLYKVCLNRNADASGLADWTGKLWNHTSTGRSVAYGFIFSAEFTGKNYNDADYVEHLYEAFMGRSSDAAGKTTWMKLLKEGWTREQVFDGFVGSKEFSDICSSYGIVRD